MATLRSITMAILNTGECADIKVITLNKRSPL